MPLPASKNQINKLGKRLAASDEISPEDSALLEDLIACHQEALEQARPRLHGLAETVGVGQLHISARPKTTRTIIEKLRRSPNGPLASIQDLAGFRIVGSFTFDQQDQLRDEVMRRFLADPPPSYKDRRAEPSYGYRAVHVFVCVDSVNIEVQIRTFAQHMWADMMERLADRLGRQIRYGGEPDIPPGADPAAVKTLVSAMMSISDAWAVEPPQTLPGMLPPSMDEFTEKMWQGLVAGISEVGIDL